MTRFSLRTLFWLTAAWLRCPRSRLGQLIDDALWLRGSSPWQAENDDLQRALRAVALRQKPPRRAPTRPRNVRRGRPALTLVKKAGGE